MRIFSAATTHPLIPDDNEPGCVQGVNRGLAGLGHRVRALLPLCSRGSVK